MPAPTPVNRYFTLPLIVLALLVPLVGVSFVRLQEPLVEDEAYGDLESVARLKTEQIEIWLRERHGDALWMKQSANLLDRLEQYAENPRDPSHRRMLLDGMDGLRAAYGYESLLLVNDAREVLLTSGADRDINMIVVGLLQRAAASSDVVTSDLYRDGSSGPRLDWVVPMARHTPSGPRVRWFFVLRSNPEHFLYPMLAQWPTASVTAETLLVRRDGDRVTYLNDPRGEDGGPVSAGSLLTTADLPTAEAVQATGPGRARGRSRLGADVYAAYRPVTGTRWWVTTQIDRDEVLVPMWRSFWWVLSVTAVSAMALLLSMWQGWRRQRRVEELQTLAEKARTDQLIRNFYDLHFLGMTVGSVAERRWVHFNDRLCEMLGYTRDELWTTNWRELTHPDDLDAEIAEFDRVLTGEIEGYRREKRFVKKDGSIVWARVDVRSIRGTDGRPEYTVATVDDVTVQRRAELELRNREQQLRSLGDHLPDGYIYQYELSGGTPRFVYLSAGVEKFHEVPRQDVLEDPALLFRGMAPESLAEYLDGEARSGRDLTDYGGVLLFRMEDGREKWLHVQSHPRRLPGGGTLWDGFAIDVTAHRLAEQQVRESEERFRKLFEESREATMLAEHGRFIDANRAAVRLMGVRTREEFLSYTLTQVSPERQPDGQLSTEKAQAEMRTAMEKGSHEFEWEHIRPNGEHFFVEVLVTVMRFGPRDILHIVWRDVTERKRTEAELALYQQSLERLVDERTKELRKAREVAESATRAKSEFLANMSHEIRTPMNAVMGMTYLAMRASPSPRVREYLEKIHGAGEHLLGIINDILDFSKIEAGKFAVEWQDFDLQAVADQVGLMLNEKATSKGLELVIDLAPDLPRHVTGDSLRLQQVLLNLGSNAVKFTEQGEIVVAGRVKEKRAGELVLEFSVRDTGIGLTADEQARLFHSFHQADSSTTRKYGGTGLGLAISKRLVELMGGEIGVRSEPAAGSTFWFTVTVGVLDAPERATATRPDLRGRRALVVDDNDTARAVLSGMLSAMTLEVSETASGEAAIGAVRDALRAGRPYEFVFMDWRMPGMDGLEAARRLNDMRLVPAPQMVVVTAHGREELRIDALRAGVASFLVKPVSASALFDTVVGLVQRSRSSSIPDHEPARDRAPSTVPRRDVSRSSAPHPARILVVEDNDLNQELARELLTDAGLLVDVAGNGEIAVRMVQQAHYDMVLMDMQMPVMDGLEATAAIRRLPGFDALPIVAITANAMRQDQQRCFEAGMNDYIAKPIEPAQLYEAVERWTGRTITAP